MNIIINHFGAKKIFLIIRIQTEISRLASRRIIYSLATLYNDEENELFAVSNLKFSFYKV
jgi:hypothetical protein